MAKTFKSYVELQKGLEQYVRMALNEVGERTWEELYKFIEDEVYIKNTLKISGDEGYERTYDFLNSLKKKSSVKQMNGFVYEIYFDTDSIGSEYRNGHLFNSHMSVNGDINWNGSSVASWMPAFVEAGINSPFYSHTGIGFMRFIEEFLNRNFNMLMRKELARLGIKVK